MAPCTCSSECLSKRTSPTCHSFFSHLSIWFYSASWSISTSQFHSKLLTYSTNHFLLSRFHALTSLLWLFWPGFRTSISHSFSLYHPRPFIHPHYGLLLFTVSGNKPPSIYLYIWLAFAGTLNLLTHFIVSLLLVHILSLYISFISLSCEAIIIIIIC